MSFKNAEGIPVRKPCYHPQGGKLMTKQADKDSCDINSIMKKYTETGVHPVSAQEPYYGDFSDSPSYHEGMDAIASAQQTFERLPSHVRKHVHNDPGEFLDLVNDPDRRDELVSLGLATHQIPAKKAEKAPEPPKEPAPTPAPT